MKMTAHLMDKGLNKCLDPDFENRIQVKKSGPFDLTTDDGKKFKEAVDLNKKVMGQFIQAFSICQEVFDGTQKSTENCN